MLFYGLSGVNKIGGSSYYIQTNGKKILLDMGIDPKNKGSYPPYENLYRNRYINSIGDLDAVAISHGHLDHIGSLPYILQEGKGVPILASKETRYLGEILLTQGSKDKLEFVENLKKQDVKESFSLIKSHETFEDEDLEINFYDGGHILGSKMIEVVTSKERILYTGDFSLKNSITCKKADIYSIKSPDILLCEGTNLNRNFNSFINERLGFIRHINKIVSKGVLLIPAFALGRTQEVLCLLKNAMKNKLLKKVPIYVDGLSIEVSEIYNFLGVNILDDSIKIAPYNFYNTMDDSPKIIVCSSGMLLENSMSNIYWKKLMTNENNGITFVGYQDKSTPGFDLLYNDGFQGKKATVNKFNFSAHGDQEEIFHLIEVLEPKKVIFVHRNLTLGEEENIKKILKKLFGKKIDFYFPQDGEEINL